MNSTGSSAIFVKMTSVDTPPFVTIQKDRHGVFQAAGPFGELNKEFVKRLDIRYVIDPPITGGYGTMLPNGTPIGMAALIYRKEADLILGPYSLNYDRFKAVDYLPVLMDEPVTLLALSQNSEGTVDFTNTVMRVDWMIWVCLLIGIGVTCLGYVFDDNFRKKTKNKFRNIYFWEFSRIFINQGSSVFLTGSATIPKRILLLCFTISMFFFNAYFGGDLHTEAVVYIDRSIDSLEELVKESKACLLIQKDSFEEIIILSRTGGIYDQIHERMHSCPVSSIPAKDVRTDATYQMIESSKFVLLNSMSPLLYIGFEMCNKYPNKKFHLASQPVFITLKTVAVGRHMDPAVKKVITKVIQMVINGGIMLKWMNDAKIQFSSPCLKPRPKNIEPELTLGDLESLKNMFIVWMAGSFIAIIALFIEILIHFFERRRKQRMVKLHRRKTIRVVKNDHSGEGI